MPYDDIRFSGWDDPDDEDSAGIDGDLFEYVFEYDGLFESECQMCGRDRLLNEEGYCFSCWQERAS